MFSKLGRATIKTLRHYDEMGLLKPALVDGETGYRYYNYSQLYDLHEIMALRQMGFSLAEVGELQSGRGSTSLLEKRREELAAQQHSLTDQIFRLDHYMKRKQEGQAMKYQAVIKEIPKCIVFSVRRILPNYGALFSVMPEIGEKVGRSNPDIQCVQPDYCFNVYHDGEYKETDIDAEICQAVTSMGQDFEDIHFKEMPGITAATILHKGPYEDLGNAYAFALEWIEKNGYTIAGEFRESYIDGIWNTPDPQQWLSEIQIPVTK